MAMRSVVLLIVAILLGIAVILAVMKLRGASL